MVFRGSSKGIGVAQRVQQSEIDNGRGGGAAEEVAEEGLRRHSMAGIKGAGAEMGIWEVDQIGGGFQGGFS